jgi:hypothetical protein
VLELFTNYEQAASVLRACDTDEPDEAGDLHVEPIELVAGRAELVTPRRRIDDLSSRVSHRPSWVAIGGERTPGREGRRHSLPAPDEKSMRAASTGCSCSAARSYFSGSPSARRQRELERLRQRHETEASDPDEATDVVSVFADAGALLAASIIRCSPPSEEQQLNQDGPCGTDDGDQRGEPRQLCSTDFDESAHTTRKYVSRGTGHKPKTAGDRGEEDGQPVDGARWGGQWQGEQGR